MTEKRYYYDRELDKIKNRETGDDYWFLCDIADLLNKQDEKIKELEIELRNKTAKWEYELGMKLKYHSKLIDSEKEKKELQSKAKTLLDFYSKRYGDAIFGGQRHSKTLREELWVVKQVLSELGLYGDD